MASNDTNTNTTTTAAILRDLFLSHKFCADMAQLSPRGSLGAAFYAHCLPGSRATAVTRLMAGEFDDI